MSEYYNVLYIDDYTNKKQLHRAKLNIIKKMLIKSNINANIDTLYNRNEDINIYDLAIVSLNSVQAYKNFKVLYEDLLKFNIPMVSWGGLNELNLENSKEIFENIENLIEKDELKTKFQYYKRVALNGYISQKLFENEKYNIVGNPLIYSSRIFDEKQYFEVHNELENNNDYILLNFNELENKLNNEDSSWVYEQIEILIQILLNMGNSVIVTSSDEDYIKCNAFVNKFGDDNIKLKSSYSIYEVINLINMSKMVIDLGTNFSMIATGLNKPFISIGYDIDYLDLKSIVAMDDMFISVYEINAGKMIDKLEKLDGKYDVCVDKLQLICNNCFDESLEFVRKVFYNINPKAKKSLLLKNTKKKIIIISNHLYSFIPYIMDKNKCEIITVLNNGVGIEEYDYDYILNCSDSIISEVKGMIVKPGKVIDFSRWFLKFFDYEFYKTYYEFNDREKDYEGIITGISYHEVAIDTKKMDKNFYNFAISGEDLFFNYNKVKDLILNKNIKSLKYVILGLSYYSFQYDLSKTQSSFGKFRSNIYFPFYNTMHNYSERIESIQFYEEFKKNGGEIFLDNYERIIYEMTRSNVECNWHKMINSTFNSEKLTKEEADYEINEITNNGNKNYPMTVLENREIFKKYLDLLKANNIKPFIVICPVTNFYRKYFSKTIRKEFYGIIENFKKEYKFEVFDFYESKEFSDEDFYNPSHLNITGAEKFTKMINDLISMY